MSETDRQDGLIERALARLGRLIHRRAGLLTAVVVLSMVPAALLASQLELRASFLDLLPENERPVRELRQVIEHARAPSNVLVAIPRDDPELAERFARELIPAFETRPEVLATGGWIDVSFFEDRQLLYVDESELEELVDRAEQAIDRELLLRTGLYIDFEDESEEGETTAALLADVDEADGALDLPEWVVTTDDRYLCIWAFVATPSSDLDAARVTYAAIRETVDGVRAGSPYEGLAVRYAGGIPVRIEGDTAMREDLTLAGVVGFSAVVLFIVIALRTPRALVLLSVPLLSGLAWTFAFAELAVGHLNIISGFLFSILSGLGIEYGIHLLHRYRTLREEGLGLEPAIERLLPSTGRALVSGALTNASVFGIIALAQFRGFSEFGIIAAAGLLITLVTTMVGLPALLVIMERWRPMHFPEQKEETRGVSVPTGVRRGILILVPALAAASAFVLATGGASFDGSWRLLAGDTDASNFGEYLRHHLGGRHTAAMLWAREGVDLGELRHVVEELGEAREAAGEDWDVVAIGTIDKFYPAIEKQRARSAIADRLGIQLDRIRPGMLDEAGETRLADARQMIEAARPFSIDEVPYSAVGHMLTSDGTGSMVRLMVEDHDDSGTDALTSWAAQARAVASALTEADLHAPMLSENWVAGEIFERVARDGRFLLFGTFFAVFLVLLIDFRGLRPALAVLGAVALGVVSIAGALWLTGLRLNFMNIAILPVCVAISLDNAIHVYHRWRDGGPGSIPVVLRQTTVANALSSTTNLLGFTALALTHHAGLRSVAFLAMIGVGLTYISTSIWFPMVLATYDQWRASRVV
ncbi:MAG: MMPL family transporter [Deltaproteobacteria bacterium]|nr:MMPL family transporter [Deltaproteobacteria bacterium]